MELIGRVSANQDWIGNIFASVKSLDNICEICLPAEGLYFLWCISAFTCDENVFVVYAHQSEAAAAGANKASKKGGDDE